MSPTPRRSAGLLPYRTADHRLEVMIGHMGGPYWARKDEGAWTIFKGEYADGEDPLAAARREFEEETGLPAPDGDPLALGEIRQSGGKLVIAWAIEADLDAGSIVSNTFTIEWPPRSGTLSAFPEIDRGAGAEEIGELDLRGLAGRSAERLGIEVVGVDEDEAAGAGDDDDRFGRGAEADAERPPVAGRAAALSW